MTNGGEDGHGGGGGYHRVQAERDLQSNWEVDLARKLEGYLLKICSGEIIDESDDPIAINFAEAALLLQGSVQVYSRKVEYLYSLVLRALEFLSQKRQEEQAEGTTDQPGENPCSEEVCGNENDLFWDLDDIPVEAKNSLDTRSDEDANLNKFVKPPANLVVLEGDCLDNGGDAGELESFLLATSDLFKGFILLDPCDAETVNAYLDEGKTGKGPGSNYRGSTARKSFQSPIRSGGASRKQSAKKDANKTPQAGCSFDPQPSNVFNDGKGGFDMDDRHFEPDDFGDHDDDDNDDPWKPLNPHEPGNSKVKPFRKVKFSKRVAIKSSKDVSLSTMFPPARLQGTICPELRSIWEMRHSAHGKRKRPRESPSVPLYEKLRQQLVNDGSQSSDYHLHPKDYEDDGNHSGDHDFTHNDVPEFMDEDIPFQNEQHDSDGAKFGLDDPFGDEDLNSQVNLEDLCRSHLDTLLANIAQTEKQSELAARVTTWKHKIEQNLDEQDSHPEFDIHRYGDKILDKLSLSQENGNVLSFSDVVRGETKYDVARTFSAMLQLVNNGDVELDRNGLDESVCFTALNPFNVKLLRNKNTKDDEPHFDLSRKRVKSPTTKKSRKGNGNFVAEKLPAVEPTTNMANPKKMMSPQPNGKFSKKIGRPGVSSLRCTPEGKRRRRSRLIEPVVDLPS